MKPPIWWCRFNPPLVECRYNSRKKTYITHIRPVLEYAHGALDSLLIGSRNRHGLTDLITRVDILFILLLFRLWTPFVTIHVGEATSQSEAPSLLTIPTLLSLLWSELWYPLFPCALTNLLTLLLHRVFIFWWCIRWKKIIGNKYANTAQFLFL